MKPIFFEDNLNPVNSAGGTAVEEGKLDFIPRTVLFYIIPYFLWFALFRVMCIIVGKPVSYRYEFSSFG